MEKITDCLDKLLLNRNIRLDRYDANYIDDFHFIMKENYDIDSCKKGHNDIFDTLILLLKTDYHTEYEETDSLLLVTEVLKGILQNEHRYKPKISSDKDIIEHNYNNIPNWESLKKKNDVTSMLEIQIKYSLQSGGNLNNVSPDSHFNARFANEKHVLFNTFDKTYNILSVGNRWKDEIVYIRDKFNLPNTIGLDLFSNDNNYVKIGDIHNTKFDDNTFDVIYQKNTFNKLYDLRKALIECMRILKPGGLLISDDCYDYSMGVNPLARTNVTTNKWYFSFMKDNIDKILIDIENPINLTWLRNTGLFAIKIKK